MSTMKNVVTTTQDILAYHARALWVGDEVGARTAEQALAGRPEAVAAVGEWLAADAARLEALSLQRAQ